MGEDILWPNVRHEKWKKKNSTFEEDVLCILLGAKPKNQALAQAFETLAYFISETFKYKCQQVVLIHLGVGKESFDF